MIKIHEGRTQEELRCRKEDTRRLLFKIYTSHFIARFACEWMLEIECKLHILTPLLWPSRCVFLNLLILNHGVHSIGAFPRSPSVRCGLPYHIWSLLSGSLLATAWDPNSTELNNNSTPTRSPTGSLNRMSNRHQAEITVMQFRSYSLPVHDCNGRMGPSPFPIS